MCRFRPNTGTWVARVGCSCFPVRLRWPDLRLGSGIFRTAGAFGPTAESASRAGLCRPNCDDTEPAAGAASARTNPIKVGILHSLSGPLAVSERPTADASLLAIEELNAEGGVLGVRSKHWFSTENRK